MDIYGLIGFPLKHSFSARFFAEKFEKEHIDAEYRNFEIDSIDLLPGIIDSTPGLKGLNVTLPYKEQVIRFLDELDETAEAVGAVNVIKITRSGGKVSLKGYNSDLIGFRNSISPLIDPAKHFKALILGTGGASKAVDYALKSLGLETRFVSRSQRPDMYTYYDLAGEILEEYKVIVNASPLGTFPDVEACPSIPYELLGKNHLLYDLVYNPPVTKFLELGNIQGAVTKNGEEMLWLQALAAWDIWNEER
ncbi:MAG TPA: shikimate dehydrogenase [Dysgonomonas sp.]|nr:shikimate dehydrogenase [Dysgonomonas sp.]